MVWRSKDHKNWGLSVKRSLLNVKIVKLSHHDTPSPPENKFVLIEFRYILRAITFPYQNTKSLIFRFKWLKSVFFARNSEEKIFLERYQYAIYVSWWFSLEKKEK